MKYIKTFEKIKNVGNIIFLDMNGVIIPYNEHSDENSDDFNNCSKEAIIYLNLLVKEMDAKVVLTSSYREKYTKNQINKRLKKEGFKGEVIDFTDVIKNEDRWFEILKWTNNNNINKYIILDDKQNDNIKKHFPDNFVECDHDDGFIEDDYKKALKLFKKL